MMTLIKVAFSLISSVVSVVFVHLQIFRQQYLWHTKVFDRVWHPSLLYTGFELSILRSPNAIYFSIIAMPKKSHFTIFAINFFFVEFCHKLKSYGISGGIFGLILSFLSHGGQRVVREENSLLKYPYNVGVPQESMLGTMLSHCTLIATFVMMLSIILLSLQMIGLFTLMVIRLLICVNNQSWLMNQNLAY